MATSNPSRRASAGRQTEPPGYDATARGGLGLSVRRTLGGTDLDLSTARSVELSARDPLALLRELPYLHPTVDLALDTVLNLACAPGDVRIDAVLDGPNGEETDEEGTAAIHSMLNSMPTEFSGLYGLLRMSLQEVVQTGMSALEAVPGPVGVGVVELWPIDSLTLSFKRGDDGRLGVHQRQVKPATTSQATWDGLVPLSSETTFWSSLNATVQNPYGRPLFGTAVNECLADVAMIRDVRAAIHMAGHPRYVQTFPMKATIAFAMAPDEYDPGKPDQALGLGYDQADAIAYAQRAFMDALTNLGGLLADDAMIVEDGSEIEVLDGAKGMQALEKILVVLRQRLSQAVKTPGLFLGINDGDTETNAIRQLEVYVARLESVRGVALEPIYNACGLCLRLLGRGSRPKVVAKPIRATDALLAAQNESAVISNTERKVNNGWLSPDDGSKAVTGSLPFDPKRAENPGTHGTNATVATQSENPTTGVVAFKRGGKPLRRAA